MTTAGLIRAIHIAVIAVPITYRSASIPAWAGSSAQPGQTVGQAPGAPLPIGLYFIDTSSFGSRDITPRGTDSNINLPSFIWATPAEVVCGRLQLVVLQPITASSTRGAAY